MHILPIVCAKSFYPPLFLWERIYFDMQNKLIIIATFPSLLEAHAALQVDIKQGRDWVMHAILMKISGVQATVFSCHAACQQERGEKM